MAGRLRLLCLVLLLSISAFSIASNIATAENQSPLNGGYNPGWIHSEDVKDFSKSLCFFLPTLRYCGYVYRSAYTEDKVLDLSMVKDRRVVLNMPSGCQSNLFYGDTWVDILFAGTLADTVNADISADIPYADTLADVLYASAWADILSPDPWADTLSTPRDSIGLDAESIMGLRLHLKELTNHPPELPRSRKSKMRGPLVQMPLRRWLPVGLKGPFVPCRGFAMTPAEKQS